MANSNFTTDCKVALYALVPAVAAATAAVVFLVVGVSFGSVAVALRLAFTVAVSLAWTYGGVVFVYQPGPGQRALAGLSPALRDSPGLFWVVPVMAFSILVGLALDYDIFLMSRAVEFRRRGWSDRAAVCLAVEKTGGVISAAGGIMALSFGGLLLPKTTARGGRGKMG